MVVLFEELRRPSKQIRKIMFHRTECRSRQTQVSDLSESSHSRLVEGEEALEGNLDLWGMCMRYPCVDIPVWCDPPGVMGAGSSNLDRSNLNTCVVDSSDD